MSAVAQRNTGTLPQQTPVYDNDDRLLELAQDFKTSLAIEEKLSQNYQMDMIQEAVKRAYIIKEGRELTSGEGFENWTKQYLGISSTYAYNHLKLLDNQKLIDFAVHTSGQVEIGHVFALLPKRNESEQEQAAREEVMQRIESGEKVSVAEINEYKKRAKKAEAEAAQARKDADEWRVSCQTQQEINQRNNDLIERKADEKLKEKQAEIEQAAINTAAAEYQATIDSLKDTVSNQRAKLATIEREGERDKIQAEINEKLATLKQLEGSVSMMAYEAELRNVAALVVEQCSHNKTELLKIGKADLSVEDKTFNLLMDASEALKKLSKLFFELANPANLTVEE